MRATGSPKKLLTESNDAKIIQFLTRGESNVNKSA
jgi:phospholipid/cholesterol/gamma-HCH transport system ATP-binding protein